MSDDLDREHIQRLLALDRRLRNARAGPDYPRPIHDYRDATKYPSEGVFWQWEFLRRDDQYQLMCDHDFFRHDCDDNEDAALACAEYFGGVGGRYPSWAGGVVHDSDEPDSERRFDFWHYRDERGPSAAPTVTTLDREWSLAFPWELEGPLAGTHHRIAPDVDSDSPFSDMVSPYSEFSMTLYQARERIPHVDDRLLVLAFDAGAPLKPQLARLERLHAKAHELVRARERVRQESADAGDPEPFDGDESFIAPAQRARDLDRLLRVLDGVAAGASDKEIAGAVEKHERQVARDRKRAREYVDGGYRWLGGLGQ